MFGSWMGIRFSKLLQSRLFTTLTIKDRFQCSTMNLFHVPLQLVFAGKRLPTFYHWTYVQLSRQKGSIDRSLAQNSSTQIVHAFYNELFVPFLPCVCRNGDSCELGRKMPCCTEGQDRQNAAVHCVSAHYGELSVTDNRKLHCSHLPRTSMSTTIRVRSRR